MGKWIATADDMRAVAAACVSVIHAYVSRSPRSEVGTIQELDALDHLRDTLAALDREKAA